MNKRLIWCCTPGRSGTAYLAALLTLVPGVFSAHEGKPSFTDWYWRTKNTNQETATEVYKRFWRQKLKAISTVRESIYSETSHMTFKGFIAFLPKDVEYSVIFLERDHRKVAQSLYILNDIPGRSKTGKRNCFEPADPDNILDISCDWAQFTDYMLCYWYVREMQARADNYWELYKNNPDIITVKINVTQLQDLSWFKAMLSALGLSVDIDPVKFKLGTEHRFNTKNARKRYHTSPERFTVEERIIDKLLI